MSTLANAAQSDLVRLPEKSGARQAKAGLRSDHIGLGDLAFDALVAHYGSVKALAIELGNIDPSLVRRELKEGDFSRFDKHADADARAALADAVNTAYGRLKSPEDLADQLVRQIRQSADELQQYINDRRTA